MKNEDPYAVRKYDVPVEVVEAALEDIRALEKLANDVLELGPMQVAWGMVDRRASQFNVLGEPSYEGFASLDHAMHMYVSRLSGLRAALTTNTDGILSPKDREHRDRIVREYLERVRAACLNVQKQ